MGQPVEDEGFDGSSPRRDEGIDQSDKDKGAAHIKRMGEVSRVLKLISDEQAAKMTQLLSEVVESMKLSETDIDQVTTALKFAHLQREISGDDGPIVPYLATVNVDTTASGVLKDGDDTVPSIAEAPRNSFGGYRNMVIRICS